jgi:hypothetical protein
MAYGTVLLSSSVSILFYPLLLLVLSENQHALTDHIPIIRTILAADSGSIYDPHPTLTYTWDPEQPIPIHLRRATTTHTDDDASTTSPTSSSQRTHASSFSSAVPPSATSTIFPSPTHVDNAYYPHAYPVTPPANGSYGGASSLTRPRPSITAVHHSAISYELGPHPADPHSVAVPGSSPISSASPNYAFPIHDSGGFVHNGGALPILGASSAEGNGVSPSACSQQVRGQELWVYAGTGG